ncbi:huntingtin-like isoform X2 [Temnothorax longispinosus]|uniref:huntingtin-like isoform X2 n=1 Tax=Temnothorax longispinosus TaxID=300112 RepID=UPI003A98EEF3
MAHLNGVLKAVETLNALRESDAPSDPGARYERKEKVSCCAIIVEGVCSPTVRQNPKFPQILSATIETLLALCNDEESDVRMVADESLNKIIRAMVDSNVVKIQIELYNEIKRNGPARILRTALWRFGLLSHMIRPSRGKAYVANLIPCIVIIAHRSEDTVIETLSQSLPLIFKVLGPFMTDKDVKNLLRAFFENISSPQAAFRRAAANMILTTCINCRKPQFFLNYVMDYTLDIITSGKNADDHSSTVIGVFGCLRVILPYICKPSEPQDSETQQIDNLLHIYELCLYYTKWHSDHNVINAALETLAQLLKMPSKPLVSVLLSSKDITQSRIMSNQNACLPSLGHMSISSASTAHGGNLDSILNLHEPDIPEITSNAEWIADTETTLKRVIHKRRSSVRAT